MITPTAKYPGWVKIIVTAVISAACCGGIIAAICVAYLTPRGQQVTTESPTLSQLSPGSWADDAGGGGTVNTGDNPISLPPPSPSVQGRFSHAAVAVDSEPCAAIGRQVLEIKGTAVDAAVAVLFCNGVVTSQSMGIGGGFLMTIHLANGTAMSLVAREMAPLAATRDMYK